MYLIDITLAGTWKGIYGRLVETLNKHTGPLAVPTKLLLAIGGGVYVEPGG